MCAEQRAFELAFERFVASLELTVREEQCVLRQAEQLFEMAPRVAIAVGGTRTTMVLALRFVADMFELDEPGLGEPGLDEPGLDES